MTEANSVILLSDSFEIKDLSELGSGEGRQFPISVDLHIMKQMLERAYDLFEKETGCRNLDRLYPYSIIWAMEPIGYGSDPAYFLTIRDLSMGGEEYEIKVKLNAPG